MDLAKYLTAVLLSFNSITRKPNNTFNFRQLRKISSHLIKKKHLKYDNIYNFGILI